MDLMTLFSTYPGVHVVQAFFHSLTAAVIAGRAVVAWNVRNPVVRQKFYLAAVFIPLFSYPLYQWINPERGSIHFRLQALFDSGRWTGAELWGVLPVGVLLLVVLAVTAAVFLIQELVPILWHRSGPDGQQATAAAEGSPALVAAEGLANPMPAIRVLHDDDPAIFSVTRRAPAIYLTTGLMGRLDREELRAVLAHEVAHIERSRRPLLIVAYLARVLMFFSPGTLVAFRRAAAEEEKICDDWAVAATGKPQVLAAVLEKLRDQAGAAEQEAEEEQGNLGEAMRSMERMSYDLMVQDRIRRLAGGATAESRRGDWVKLAVTVATILAVNYYVV